MYAVIFRAELHSFDEKSEEYTEYEAMALDMRNLAIKDYGCIDFSSTREGAHEITVSYWPDLDSIKAWKVNKEHIYAQKLGRDKWYNSYQVEVVEILKHYEDMGHG